MPLVRENVAAMRGYAPGEQPTDPAVIKLNTNENPYPPSPNVLTAIRLITPEQLRRYPSPDAKLFRDAAAEIHYLTPDHIIATNGGDELLALAVRACAGETHALAYLEPSYSLYPVLAEMQGAQKVILPYNISGTKWALPSELEGNRAAQLHAAVLLIVNPNAPSGTFTPVPQLADIAAHFQGLLVIDEAYVDFAEKNAISLVKKHENVLILRSMSKGYGLAGMRFGYGVGQPALIAELHKIRDSYPNDAVSIAAATAAIQDQSYAKSTWAKVKQERVRLTEALHALGFHLPESQSNFVLAQVPSSLVDSWPVADKILTSNPYLPARLLYDRLKERNILVRYFNLPHLTDKLRITIGTPEQNDKLLAELKTLLGR